MKDIVNRFVDEFDPDVKKESPPDRIVLSIWIKAEEKRMFDELQAQTRKKFGRDFKDFVTETIRQCYEKSKK